MSALTAVILSALISTPIVHVSHDRVSETPRATPPLVNAIAADIGIDERAVNTFVRDAARRYQGIR